MSQHTARILTLDDQPLIEDVTVDITVREISTDGLRAVKGHCTPKSAYGVHPGQHCKIILDDGRTGVIMIQKMHVSSHAPPQIDFHVQGGLQEA